MKIPAVAIATAFAGGIVLGRSALVAARATQHWFLRALIAILGALLLLAFLFAWRDFLRPAVATSLLSWLGLGMLTSCLAQQPIPPEHILSRIATQQVPLRTPLRWTGILREEPSRLPWGYGFEVNLQNVETAAGTLPVTGGMRIGFTPREDDFALPPLHAGDRVSIFAEAHLPLV
jgi:Domain of unknown function (DUF4131)